MKAICKPDDDAYASDTDSGLSKREIFAMATMQGLVSSVTIGRIDHMNLMCETSVQYADALIEALNKSSEDKT